jgi:hypothetical protein
MEPRSDFALRLERRAGARRVEINFHGNEKGRALESSARPFLRPDEAGCG